MNSPEAVDSPAGKTHLTFMNDQTTISAKGQVVIPKDVRDRLGFLPGQALMVTSANGSVILSPLSYKSGRSAGEIMAEIREIAATYKGPPVTIDEMNETIAEGWRRSALDSDR